MFINKIELFFVEEEFKRIPFYGNLHNVEHPTHAQLMFANINIKTIIVMKMYCCVHFISPFLCLYMKKN